MKHKIKLFLIPFVLLATLFLVTACSGKTTPYDDNNAKGHTVSVKFDANGGVFTGTSTVMVDSFNITDMKKDQNGMVNLKLLDPTDSKRGDWTPSNGNKVLAGWYKTRTESTDSDGNVVYTYSDEFVFETSVVTVDPSKTYDSAEPVLTLYAVWVDKFVVNFIDIEDGTKVLGTYEFNPKGTKVLNTPVWNTETGTQDLFSFPNIEGKTFVAAYNDAAGTDPIGDVIVHDGKINAAGVGENTVKNVYVKYTEGKWYHIYNAKQLNKISDLSGHYVLHADLDFSEKGAYWPSAFVYGTFTGSIEGNGFAIRNVNAEQGSNTDTETGLFGRLSATAKITDVTFENVTLNITKGTRTPGACFGLLAGKVDDGVQLKNVAITSGVIKISTEYWDSDDFAIGLLCGMGSFAAGSDLAAIDFSGITCEKSEDVNLTISVEGNTVTIVVD